MNDERYSIIYSSRTGNTRLLAEAIRESLPADLCNHFGIQALPTLFFVPVDGKPIIEVGASPERYRQLIEEKLLK